MKEYMNEYISSVVAFISDIDNGRIRPESDMLNRQISEFETKILYFQHERLIHLIVTVLFALLEIISIYMLITNMNIESALLCIMFLILLVPYVWHYYFLENSVQRMYYLRDKLISLRSSLPDKA